MTDHMGNNCPEHYPHHEFGHCNPHRTLDRVLVFYVFGFLDTLGFLIFQVLVFWFFICFGLGFLGFGFPATIGFWFSYLGFGFIGTLGFWVLCFGFIDTLGFFCFLFLFVCLFFFLYLFHRAFIGGPGSFFSPGSPIHVLAKCKKSLKFI